jgi:hypothetical protein
MSRRICGDCVWMRAMICGMTSSHVSIAIVLNPCAAQHQIAPHLRGTWS